jgi:hypothetical protein
VRNPTLSRSKTHIAIAADIGQLDLGHIVFWRYDLPDNTTGVDMVGFVALMHEHGNSPSQCVTS